MESLKYFDTVKTTIARLTEWESRFYKVQQDALKQMPRALAELDARLAKVLAQSAPKEAHTVVVGVQTDKAVAAQLLKQRVRDTPGKVLAKAELEASRPKATRATPRSSAKTGTKVTPEIPLKEKPEPIKPSHEGPNGKKQAVADAGAVADRERITKLANEGKIGESRKILQPYLDAAKAAKTPAEKKAAMDAIVERLDVTSDKEKMFWSGNKELAAKIAKEKGKTILEQTPGGSLIDGWDDLNNTFSWKSEDMPPHGWDLWGDVSAKYSKDATGAIDVIQDLEKSFPGGGTTWRGREWPTIVDEDKVTSINIFGMGKNGDILETMKIKPNGEVAKKLFGGK